MQGFGLEELHDAGRVKRFTRVNITIRRCFPFLNKICERISITQIIISLTMKFNATVSWAQLLAPQLPEIWSLVKVLVEMAKDHYSSLKELLSGEKGLVTDIFCLSLLSLTNYSCIYILDRKPIYMVLHSNNETFVRTRKDSKEGNFLVVWIYCYSKHSDISWDSTKFFDELRRFIVVFHILVHKILPQMHFVWRHRGSCTDLTEFPTLPCPIRSL